MLFFKKENKKEEELTVKDLKELLSGESTLSDKERIVFLNVVKCIEEHDHPLVRRTGIGCKSYMQDLCQYCNWLLIDVLELSHPFYSSNMEYVRNGGSIPVDLLKDQLSFASGRFKISKYSDINYWNEHKFFTEPVRTASSYQYIGKEKMMETYGKNLFIIIQALIIVNAHFLPLM